MKNLYPYMKVSMNSGRVRIAEEDSPRSNVVAIIGWVMNLSRVLSVFNRANGARSFWMMSMTRQVAMLGLVLIPALTCDSVLADSPQVLKTDQDPQANRRPVRLIAAAPEDALPTKKEASEVATFGDDDVDPIEIIGQVIDINEQPAVKSIVRFEAYSRKSLTSWSSSMTTGEEGRFRVRLRIEQEWIQQLKLTVVSSDNSQMAYFRFPRDKGVEVQSIRIQLEASRVVQIRVVGKSGAPIDKSNAALQLTYPQTADSIQTGADGIAQFVIPEKERINAIVAWKADAGLDYRQYEHSRNPQADSNANANEFPEGGIETLVLEGASPVSVRVLDEEGSPLNNVGVYPWLLQKPPALGQLNLSMFGREFEQKTNEDGMTTFAWIPSWQTGMIQFWPNLNNYDRQRGNFTPGQDKNPLVITLKKLVPIRGHIRDMNGAPVSGVNISAIGAGYTFDPGHAMAVSEKDGSYELLVSPDQIYLVIASMKGLASAPQTGFAVFKGKPVDGKDFILRAATRVHGTLLDDETLQPIAKRNVFVYQYGQGLHTMKDVALPNPEKLRWAIQPTTVHYAQTDDKGQFELFVGDGSFDIRPPQQEKAEKFEIAGELEREFVVKTKLSKEVELNGTVSDQATHLPLSKALIQGVSRSHGGHDWRAKSNPEGEFRVMQFPAAAFVFAVSADGKLGAIAEVEAKQASVALNLQPVGTARGRLLKTGTDEPWGSQAVSFGVRVPDEDNRTWSNRFGGRVTTAADGTFELIGLVPGWKYEMQMEPRNNGIIPMIGHAMVKPGEAIDLGDVSPPPPPKPYVPPTLEERIQSAFEVKGTAIERHAKANDRIRLVNQHLLIVFGVPKDPRIHSLLKIRFEDADFRPFNDEFLLMAIPTDEEHRPEADQLASLLNESLEGDRSAFLLVLLDSTGKKVETIGADQLIFDGQLDREKLFEWLRRFQMEPKDARKLLDDALVEARKQNKRVLVQETATWCGPCYSLSRFLNANRAWEKDYLWVKMDHRYAGVQDVMGTLRGKDEGGGIPWYVILDADGKKLATSNDLKTKQNIGYPGEPSGQAHFEQMLKTTRLRLTDDDIAGMMHALTAGH